MSLGRLPLQVAVILAATRLCAVFLRRLRQPAVIGEVVGGILLGPSALGLLWPAGSAALFPPASLAALGALSRAGLVAFLFTLGWNLDVAALRREARVAVLVSLASIAVPFLLGVLLARVLYGSGGYAPAGVPFSVFACFFGVAMSITAFPVLARILRDRGLSGSALGTTVLACAAVDDIAAWCALAVVAAASRGGGGHPPLFLAFIAGVVLPKPRGFFRKAADRLESLCVTVLLPVFFALSGLRTQVGLLADLRSWAVCVFIVLVAVAGKLGGSALTARWTGKPWRQALALGALMNARGLVELIVLNLGYELGVVTPRLFAMMVLMALATTLMTGPLLDALSPRAGA